jgi:hypothetical protein
MIRASGVELVTDIPWLSEQPVTGTISADSRLTSTITLNAAGITTTGVYSAALDIRFGDSRSFELTIPVTMTVIDYAYLFLSLVSK